MVDHSSWDLVRTRIEAKAIRSESGCWNWPNASPDGYAKLTISGVRDRVHRWAFRAYVGPIEDGLHVLHHCDNKLCCNPTHLFLGTHADNMKDMADKGIGARGLNNSCGKLTDEQVVQMRAKYKRGFPISWLADEFGVHRNYVHQIVRNKPVKNGRSARYHAGQPAS
ncbi:HNH endonuclease [Mycobacterium marinum]|uniref:HNH endonuclease n=1 Tax=Mycobacterium marinum TaxID=1781 RepID=UPI001379C41E|nr:HNH endonuclease [Mycobacterium marinum]